MYGKLAGLLAKAIRSLVAKDASKGKLFLNDAWKRFSLKGPATSFENLFKSKKFFSSLSRDDVKVFVLSMLAAYSIDEISEFANSLSSAESAETGGDIILANDIISELKDIQHTLKVSESIYDDFSDLDGEKGVSVNDAIVVHENAKGLEKISVLHDSVELRSAVSLVKDIEAKVRRLSYLTGLRPEHALELAELINEANGSWGEILDEAR